MTFLGIDGGGSKTTFLLEDNEGQTLAHFQTGPSNWLSSGSDKTRAALTEGIHRLPSIPDIVCGGFAGAGRPEGVEFYRNCLSNLIPGARLFVETDAFITFIGAIGLKAGVLLIAGTGSIALARRNDGTVIRAGGWGPAFSDEGAGFWIGSESIRSALRAHDAGEAPEFISAVEKALALKRITEVQAAWKEGTIAVSSVASLAAIVTALYPAEPAKRIVDEAASRLRALAETARRRADLPTSCIRSISGSLGNQSLIQQLVGLEFVPPAHPPERGAILWARDRMTAS